MTHDTSPFVMVEREVLEIISGLSASLRAGGPDPMDLQELSDSLERACELADNALASAPAQVVAQPSAYMWEEVVDPTGEVIVGKTVTRFATHWSTPPSNAAVTPLYIHPVHPVAVREAGESNA